MKVYLAGGMHGKLSEAIRLACSDHDWIEWLDPASWQDQFPEPAQYTKRDLAAITEADVVVAFMDPSNPSGYGMLLEVGYAHALGKPICFVDLLGSDWRSKYFGMVRSVARSIAEGPETVAGALKCLAS